MKTTPNRINNYAFIDGQNLYKGLEWKIDFKKFRIFLRDKFRVKKAYYFLGFKEEQSTLYEYLQDVGFILIFNEKPKDLKSEKKGNIDVCLVFNAMKKSIENDFDNIILVSGDGDFKIMTDYFIEKNKFLRIIFPNKKYASSLYNKYGNKYIYYLNDTRTKLEYKKEVS